MESGQTQLIALNRELSEGVRSSNNISHFSQTIRTIINTQITRTLFQFKIPNLSPTEENSLFNELSVLLPTNFRIKIEADVLTLYRLEQIMICGKIYYRSVQHAEP